jgi:voltage-gated sodium channel type II alpha
MLFFVVIIFLGSYYLVNLILAIVAMSYDELQKKAEEDDMAAAAEFEAMRSEDEARQARAQAREDRADARAEAAEAEAEGIGLRHHGHQGHKSPGGGSSDGSDDGQGGAAGVTSRSRSRINLARARKASMSLPGSPYVGRSLRGGGGGSQGAMVLSTYMDAQEHLPYADDSTAATPMSEENGAILLPHHSISHNSAMHNNAFQVQFGEWRPN